VSPLNVNVFYIKGNFYIKGLRQCTFYWRKYILVRGPTHIGVKVRTKAILLLIVLDRVIGSENQEGATLAPLSNFFISRF